MYRVYNLRPQPAPANWAHDNRQLLVGLVFLVAFSGGHRRQSKDFERGVVRRHPARRRISHDAYAQ